MSWWCVLLLRHCYLLIRPPDIVVSGLRFYRDSVYLLLHVSLSIYFSLLLLLFVSYPSSSLNGTHPKPATWSEVSAIWKNMFQIWGILFPYKSGAQKHLFATTSQFNGNFNNCIFGTKHDMHNRVNAFDNQGISYIVSKCHELWWTKGLK